MCPRCEAAHEDRSRRGGRLPEQQSASAAALSQRHQIMQHLTNLVAGSVKRPAARHSVSQFSERDVGRDLLAATTIGSPEDRSSARSSRPDPAVQSPPPCSQDHLHWRSSVISSLKGGQP